MNDKAHYSRRSPGTPPVSDFGCHAWTSKALAAAFILIVTFALFYRYDLLRSPRFSATTSSDIKPYVMQKIDIDPTKTTDLGWIPSGLPKGEQLKTTNPFAAERTATGPLGKPEGKAYDWEDFSPRVLKKFWNVWVGPVIQPPFDAVPLPPRPYPLLESPPPLYPEYYSIPPEKILPELKFPSDFLFGWSTASQQYEGAVQTDGKGPTVWDWVSRFPGVIADNTTSDIADLGYYLYKQDLARLAALGANAYSFSISWARIFPFGMKGTPVNEKGLQYYEDLVDYCLELGIEPVITLFHWDTPLALLAEYGGWGSPGIVDDYVNYAGVIFRRFNGKVTKWFTFNEPGVLCGKAGYPWNTTYPEKMTDQQYQFTSRRYVVLAHAKAYHLFKELGIKGEISYKNDAYLGIPWRANNEEDQEAVKRHHAYYIGFFADPIYLTGDWPEIVKQDLPPEILPRFSEEEKALIKGTADFFAIDGYREGFITAPPGGIEACRRDHGPGWPACIGWRDYGSTPYGWGIGEYADTKRASWLYNSWQYIRPLLKDLSEKYPTKGGIYLTEFGFAEPYENEKEYLHQITQDPARTHAIISYLGEVLKGIEDGIPIKGVFAWTAGDSWEWGQGFSGRFGTDFVDYNHPTLKRTFKRSAMEMSRFWQSHRQLDRLDQVMKANPPSRQHDGN